MKVILLKDVRGCGRAHEAVEVADGYANNFLLRHKYAVPATEEKLKEMDSARAAREAAQHKEAEELGAKIQSLEGKKVTITARATEKGGLFKAVAAPDISRALRAQHSIEIPESAITLESPIKTIGQHTAQVAGGKNKAAVAVEITAQ